MADSSGQRIAHLIIQYRKGLLNGEEQQELDSWVFATEANRTLFELLTSENTLPELEEYVTAEQQTWNIIEAAMEEQTAPIPARDIKRSVKWKRSLAAASILVILSAGAYFILPTSHETAVADNFIPATTSPNDVSPGGNKAWLTLDNGKSIILDDITNGLVATEGNVQIIKAGDGQIGYQPIAGAAKDILYNTLSTPPGGQYQLQLPDGSKVWLNAASSIRYPAAFTANERRVEVTGECYFEIESLYKENGKEKVPFLVAVKTASGRMAEISVLGTHFNINAYDDEKAIRTTLLEGKIMVSNKSGTSNLNTEIITPGQQAIIPLSSKDKYTDNTIQIVNNADLESSVGWKNGLFVFKSADIETVLRQAARWYNIEIDYSHGKPKDRFGGKISRQVNLSELLKILEYSDVHFKLEEGKRLIVLP